MLLDSIRSLECVETQIILAHMKLSAKWQTTWAKHELYCPPLHNCSTAATSVLYMKQCAASMLLIKKMQYHFWKQNIAVNTWFLPDTFPPHTRTSGSVHTEFHRWLGPPDGRRIWSRWHGSWAHSAAHWKLTKHKKNVIICSNHYDVQMRTCNDSQQPQEDSKDTW